MAKSSKEQSPKKIAQQEIISQLETFLSGLKDPLGEKKFNSRIKKAAKLLAEGLEKDNKKKKSTKVPAKSSSKKIPVIIKEDPSPLKTKSAVIKLKAKKKVQ